MVDKEILQKVLKKITGCDELRLHLKNIPLELLEMIRHYSRHSLLWKCVLAFQLAAHVSATEPETPFTIPLRELLLWERSGKSERLAGSQRELPTLRLTIDSAGISKLERLPKPPEYTGEYTNRFAFIVQDEASYFSYYSTA
jgi:hypothetical protein